MGQLPDAAGVALTEKKRRERGLEGMRGAWESIRSILSQELGTGQGRPEIGAA